MQQLKCKFEKKKGKKKLYVKNFGANRDLKFIAQNFNLQRICAKLKTKKLNKKKKK